ncbi:hypothetical protein [Vibrio alfacsensis]|uniref:hypothetical protein n=1 Tax=Vibrio alfacsensis TaxID=1074311 RepID=UPI0040680B00
MKNARFNTVMNATLLTVAMGLSTSAFSVPVSAPDGSLTLQWAGTVPAVTEPGDGYFIVKHGAVDFHNGILSFENTTDGVTLNGSSEIGFKVVKDEVAGGTYEPEIDINALQYQATLTNIKVGVNGLLAEQTTTNPMFAIHANGEEMVIGTATTKADEPTLVSVQQADGGTNPELNGGDNVVIHALITVSGIEI